MVGRFNARISEITGTTRLRNSAKLHETLMRYVKLYNQEIPQKALGYLSPIAALKEWAKKEPLCSRGASTISGDLTISFFFLLHRK